MKLPGGFEVSDEILARFPHVIPIILLVIILSVVKFAFGKEIITLFKWIQKQLLNREKTKTHLDWLAICKERQGWIQKGDAEALDLEGKHLKRLTFTISPIGEPDNWRGGFILGNERFHPQNIIDSNNAITVHAGSPPPIESAQHIWMYDWNHDRDHSHSTTVKLIDSGKVNFQLTIDDENNLTVHVNSQQVYSNKIDSSYRRKVYLLGWGDHADCQVYFENISFTI